MARQLTFDWPVGVSLGAADFVVSGANAAAYALVREPARWPEGKLVLTGPRGCGKSHLAQVFQHTRAARMVAAAELGRALPACDAPLIIEDMQDLPAGAQEPLFHLHNNLAAAGQPLLMTALTPPSRWDIALPDLASRMQATTPVAISDPDDALLQGLILKLFADRQLALTADVALYLARRIERSFAAAARAVARLDAAALAEKKPITRQFAARVLDISGA